MAAKLNSLLKKAVPWTILDGAFNLVYSIAMVVLLGFFLEPTELGLAAAALAITQFVEATYATGMQESVVRAPSGHTDQSDTAHTLALSFSVAGALFCCFIAWPVSYLYDQSELFDLILVASLVLPLNALFSIPTGILSRKIRAKILTSRIMLAKTLSFVTFVLCLLTGLGAWSIIFSTLVSSIGSLILIFLTTTRWPKIRIVRWEVKDILRYGVVSSGANFLWIGNQRIFMLLFGLFHGVHALGLFQFALRLVNELAMLIKVTVLRVGLSYFSGLNRNNEDMQEAYLLGTRMLNTLAAPIYTGLAVISPVIIPLMFGDRWDHAIPMILFMAISWLFVFPRVLAPIVLKSKGLPSYDLSFNLISSLSALTAILLTSTMSPIAAVAGWGVAQVVNMPYQLIVLRQKLSIPLWTQIKQTLPALFSSAIMGLVVWTLRDILWPNQPLLNVLSLILTGVLTYSVLIVLLDKALCTLMFSIILRRIEKKAA